MSTHFPIRALLLAATVCACSAAALSGQTLETETARLLPKGWLDVGTAYEFQTSVEGYEAALPFAFEYGLTDNLKLLVEPVPYTHLHQSGGRDVTGRGDLETTLTYRFLRETATRPALALAGEVKFPTARSDLIGTGQTDYTAYLIASKLLGPIDAHANLGYTVVGNTPGEKLNNVWNFALAGVYVPTARTELFGEVFGNTASAPDVEPRVVGMETPVTPEAPGGELVGTLGAGRYLVRNLLAYLAVSYDNTGALLFRPGVTLRVR